MNCFNLRYLSSLLLIGLLTKAHCQEEVVYKTQKEISTMLRDSSAMNYAVAAWDYSFIGEYSKSLVAYDKYEELETQKLNPEVQTAVLSDFKLQTARDYIIKRSVLEQVIIINEAHHQPVHRVFTELLLDDLYKNGFRYLGLEAIAEDSLVNIRKWVQVNDGYYTREPQFGNLIRKALSIGFTIFRYESTEKGRNREIGQAKNIEKIVKENPSAKILIHCGFNHVLEDKHPLWGKGMAGELRTITGIDPFTIDQVDFTEHSSDRFESPLFRQMKALRPSILIDSQNRVYNFSADSSRCDLKIIHPRTRYISNRPDWLFRDGTWKSYFLNNSGIKPDFPCLVSAYKVGEDTKHSVPVDQIELTGAMDKCLVLPVGSYNLLIKSSKGSVQYKKVVIK